MLLTLRQRFIFFICIAIVGFLVSGLIGGFILNKFPSSTAAMRIAAVIQSLFQLIVPSIATAMIVTRRPARFLAIDRHINPTTLLIALSALVVATPAMNLIIDLNQTLSLPESMSGFEKLLREMEDRANDSISLLQGSHTVGNLCMNILIIGILAGFGEELFFRGTFMRLLTTGRINVHIAVWSVAIAFSALHLQFYGFIPRTLLGAYFGYLLVWSRCLWIPIIIHASNNILYILWQWIFVADGNGNNPVDEIGTNGDYVCAALSSLAVTALIILLYRRRIIADN